MKRVIRNISIGLGGACFIALCVLKFLSATGVVAKGITDVLTLIFILTLFVVAITFGGVEGLKDAKKSVKNMKFCGDSFFNEIDEYKIHCGETKEHYEDMINVISFYYETGGKVDRVVGNDLLRLFNRKDFLKRKLDTTNFLVTCGTSIGLSISASLLFEIAFGTSNHLIAYIIVACLVFIVTLLFPYNDIFKSGNDEVFNYELRLLEKKIADAENLSIIKNKCEDIMLTKRNVLNILNDKYLKVYGKKRKEDIVADIRQVEKLNLHVTDIADYKKHRFEMLETKREGILLFDKNEQLANEQYEILYKMLIKYGLIYKIDAIENK